MHTTPAALRQPVQAGLEDAQALGSGSCWRHALFGRAEGGSGTGQRQKTFQRQLPLPCTRRCAALSRATGAGYLERCLPNFPFTSLNQLNLPLRDMGKLTQWLPL